MEFWRYRLYERYESNILNELINDLITNIENDSTDILIDNQTGGSVQENINFEWKEISRSEGIRSYRFRRSTNQTTFQITHNFGLITYS